MTAPVDVLAVMDVAAPHYPPLCEARAAVAELNRRACDALELLESIAPDHPRTAKLRAALANAGGAK